MSVMSPWSRGVGAFDAWRRRLRCRLADHTEGALGCIPRPVRHSRRLGWNSRRPRRLGRTGEDRVRHTRRLRGGLRRNHPRPRDGPAA